ncbi:tripeptidyl-peptidase 2 [Culicoides brevitarsis]|uniref:tripeptidyl-peptidase 2 n=1 Tax=Culicoides brevitarsis TaxID=469753 RepID=UPI00307B57F1
MDNYVDKKFPISALVPKNETGVLSFLAKHPEFNGKNVTIAIFDSGVDAQSSGLRNVPGGDVKVVERFDCSGCGDVDTSKKVQITPEGTIQGLSGRNLRIPDNFKALNPSGEYRVGLKSFADLCPSRIREKQNADFKLKNWEASHKKALNEVAKQIEDFETKNPVATNFQLKEKLQKEDLDAKMEFLVQQDKKLGDLRFSYDCVVFHGGDEGWLTVIDTTENGDLENALLVHEYSTHQEMARVDDYLTISVNVHDNGNILEIVGMCSSHGTHVASIASGYHPEDPNMNGIAPAAKIVSLGIGEGRLGSMETGTAIVRAIIKVMELCEAGRKVDVINMSYGEHAHWSNAGRVGELMSELVNRYGVVWVASAGNHGPALCTIGTPPDISQPTLVCVGAYVSPDMMEAEYSLRQKLPGNVYTWTSRGPCIDGGAGVTVCAPGAAIASVPEFTMAKAQLMNGTSMASPHVAGAVALLISGLKQKKIAYTPYSIKQALENTATKLDHVDPFAQGNGLLNVEKAFEHLCEYKNRQENEVRFSVAVGSNNAKGIHMRTGVLTKPEEFTVTIEPVMFNEKFASPKAKLDFNVHCTLVPTASWVQCGGFLDLCYTSRSLAVRVDPTALPVGVHSAAVKAYDSTCVEKGPIFEIPVTVVQPRQMEAATQYEYSPREAVLCKPNTIIRDFFQVPRHATWAVLELTSDTPNDYVGGRFWIHTQQILPNKYCKALETQKMLTVNCENYAQHIFKCAEENVLEVCIAKYWSSYGEVPLKYRIKFHGVNVKNAHVMHSASGVHRINLTSLLSEEILPAITLKTAVMVLKPTESKITSLSARDVVPPARQIYQNILTYTLHVTKAAELAIYCPLLYSVLYESEFESQLWMIFDANKQMMACGDAYSNSNYVKLDKGDYTIRLQVRHEKKECLEKVSEATVLVNFKLASSLSLDVYKSFNQAVIAGKKITTAQLLSGTYRPLYVAPLSNDRLNKAAIPPQCSWLEGTIVYAKDEATRKVDTHHFEYILTEGPAVKKNGNNNNANKEQKSKFDEYKETLRDFQIQQLAKLDTENAEMLYQDLLKSFPTHLPIHMSMLNHLDTANDLKTQLPWTWKHNLAKLNETDIETLTEKLTKIENLAKLVIEGTDQDALLKFYGMKSDQRPDAAKIKSQMDKQKQTFIDALIRKIVASTKLQILAQLNEVGGDEDLLNLDFAESYVAETQNLYTELGKFVDYNDQKVILFSLWHAFVFHHTGRQLKYLTKMYDDKPQREILEEQRLVVKGEEFTEACDKIAQNIERMSITANPQGFRVF